MNVKHLAIGCANNMLAITRVALLCQLMWRLFVCIICATWEGVWAIVIIWACSMFEKHCTHLNHSFYSNQLIFIVSVILPYYLSVRSYLKHLHSTATNINIGTRIEHYPISKEVWICEFLHKVHDARASTSLHTSMYKSGLRLRPTTIVYQSCNWGPLLLVWPHLGDMSFTTHRCVYNFLDECLW